ncbi:MAG: hypothetical protein JF595_17685 [Sphingomonadales bacterium]|nr:hypothetical protein [Sphingomonadales bacterium]
MTFPTTRLPTAMLLLAATPLMPLAAQPAPPLPGTAPPTWTVLSDETRGKVVIAAAAKGGTVQFLGGCSKSADPGLAGAFSHYRGAGLRTDGQMEHVAFYVRGADWQDAFSVRLQYSAATGTWQFAKPLAPVFLSSFSRGATLAVVNSRNQEIFSFDLTGSTTAVRTMRAVCGIGIE